MKFEEFYNESLLTIDELAERILTIGGHPLHTFEDYQHTSDFIVYKDVSDDTASVQGTKSQFESLITQEKKVKELAGESGDQETEDMMVGLINIQQKHIWMLNAWLG